MWATVALVVNAWRELLDGWSDGGIGDVDAVAAQKVVDGGQESEGVVFEVVLCLLGSYGEAGVAEGVKRWFACCVEEEAEVRALGVAGSVGCGERHVDGVGLEGEVVAPWVDLLALGEGWSEEGNAGVRGDGGGEDPN